MITDLMAYHAGRYGFCPVKVFSLDLVFADDLLSAANFRRSIAALLRAVSRLGGVTTSMPKSDKSFNWPRARTSVKTSGSRLQAPGPKSEARSPKPARL